MTRPRIALLALLLCLSMAGCSNRPPEPQAVVLVTYDTTRADRLGCYGYGDIETPATDALAKEGVLFQQATATAPITLPSHGSMMTGRQPAAHGVRNNGMFVLPDSERTLAEIFKKHGYETAAFVGAFPLASQFGLAQGFDTYDERLKTPTYEGRLMNSEELQRTAAEVNAAALPWISARKGKKFFIWVHYYDPHDIYDPPSPFRERYAHDLYDGEIAYMDSQFGQLLSGLAKAADPARTIVAVLGDHGESLGEHGEYFHGVLLYESVIRVPFILRAPGRLPGGLQVAEPVSNTDIFPTLLRLAGLGEEIQEGPPIQGEDLVPLMTKKGHMARPERATILSESLLSQLELGWSPLHAIRSGKWKYVEAPTPELYDVEADPREDRNLIAPGTPLPASGGDASNPASIAASLRSRLHQALEGLKASASGATPQPMDEETKRKLESLGYVQGAPGAPPAAPGAGPGRDPKDYIGLYQQIVDLGVVFRTEDFKKVSEACRSILAQVPEASRIQWWLGESLFALEKYDDIDREIGPLLALDDPAHLWVPGLLARVREKQGRREEALLLYRAALKRETDFATAGMFLAKLLFKMDRFGEALEEARQILVRNPRHVPALQLAADCERQLGNQEAALDLWARSLKESPEDKFALSAAGPLLFARQRYAEAQVVFERLERLDPENPRAQMFLGALAVLRGENRDALPRLRKAIQATPNSNQARYWLGMALMRTGDIQGAEAQILPLVREHPEGVEGHLALGLLRKLEGRRDEAVSEFQKVLAINPGDGVARRSLQEMGATP